MRGIGQMARECGLTVSALRFYDSTGVLVPARVDPRSNYRWYADDQVVTARLLARLRRVGMPLADICRVLENRGNRTVVDGILRAHLTRLEDGLADARRELSAARSLLDPESPMPSPTRLTVAAAELRAALRAVRYAVGTDPDLPMLIGVLLDIGHDVVRLAATDRYRLAVSAVSGAEVAGPAASVLVSVALVDEVMAALADDDSPVTVDVADGRIAVDAAGRTLEGQRLDHQFPDYRRLIRTEAAHRVDVDAARLRAAVTAAPTRTVRQEETGTEHEVSVLTLTPDGGLSVGPGSAGVLEMGLNREFLLQALDAGDAGGAGQLVLELDGPIVPLVIRVPERAGDISMLMPVRLT